MFKWIKRYFYKNRNPALFIIPNQHTVVFIMKAQSDYVISGNGVN